MTYEEAIKIFRRQLEIANKNVADFEKTFKNQKSNYRYDVELYELAISALEKQIPKKPTDICTPVVTWGRCPICKGELNKLGGKPNRVFKSDAFCHDCGQALDWSDTE